MSFQKYPSYKDSGIEWLSEVPEHWEICSIRRYLKSIFNGLTADQIDESDVTVPVTRIETISSGYIDKNRLGFINISDAREDRKLLSGDILFSNINSLNMIGNCAIHLGEADIYAGMNLLVLRPDSSVFPKWLYWLIRSSVFRNKIESLAKPAINQASISQTSINSINTARPPFSEQIAIAAYLDQETAKIDELIAEKERLIELLKEKRQALISHVVTKGLDTDVLMKDSGIEWLEAVPEHWTTLPLKRFTLRINRGVSASYVEEEEGIPILGQSCIYWDALRGNNAKMNMSVDFSESKGRLKPNDILINSTGTGTLGRAQIFNLKGDYLADSHVTIVRLHNSESARYFFYVLQSTAFQGYLFSSLVTGATNQIELSCEKLRNTGMPVPPLEEQITTANYLDQETGKIDLLVTEANKAITLLQEKRSVLISAVVTGKVDVRHLVEAS